MKKYWENFVKYRFLLRELVVTDVKLRYRRSTLGIIWSVLQPLLLMVVLTIVFSQLFKSDIPYFPVYVLTGRILWDFFSQSTIMAMNSITGNAALIKKVYVPKYIFPIAKATSTLVNTAFALIAMLIVMVAVGIKITPVLLLLPLFIFYIFLFAMGVGLILSTLSVFFRDVNYLYEVSLIAWMYLTPLFYPASILGEKFRFILQFNPLYYMIQYFREIVMFATFPSIEQNIICFSIGLLSFLIGLFVFYRKQNEFILYV